MKSKFLTINSIIRIILCIILFAVCCIIFIQFPKEPMDYGKPNSFISSINYVRLVSYDKYQFTALTTSVLYIVFNIFLIINKCYKKKNFILDVIFSIVFIFPLSYNILSFGDSVFNTIKGDYSVIPFYWFVSFLLLIFFIVHIVFLIKAFKNNKDKAKNDVLDNKSTKTFIILSTVNLVINIILYSVHWFRTISILKMF